MAAAEHGATFPKARRLRQTMTHDQLHDFAATSVEELPQRKVTRKPRYIPKTKFNRTTKF